MRNGVIIVLIALGLLCAGMLALHFEKECGPGEKGVRIGTVFRSGGC